MIRRSKMLFQIMAILATIYVGMIILADKWRKEEKEKKNH